MAAIAALGTLVYTKVLFKRPPITEPQERARIAKEELSIENDADAGTVEVKDVNVNIASTPYEEGGKKKEKTHFATLSFVLSIRDTDKQSLFDEVRPVFMDKLIQHLGKKTYPSLTSVQGRYLLRSEIVALANKLAGETIFKDVYFTQFIVE